MIAAFAIRLVYAGSCYFNPDEAEHFGAARPATWTVAWRTALTLAHPPLFILVLHGFLAFGRTELILRLPSLAGGTAALGLAFTWLRRSLGEIAALAGLGFMAIAPVAVTASTEVRQYGLLLCFVCGALYATERAFSEPSTTWAIVQALFLIGALLTNYTTIIVLGSLGFYVVVRLLQGDMPRPIVLTMIVNQCVLAALLAGLYFGQILKGRIQSQRKFELSRAILLRYPGREIFPGICMEIVVRDLPLCNRSPPFGGSLHVDLRGRPCLPCLQARPKRPSSWLSWSSRPL